MNARTLYLVDDNEDFLQATQFWLEGIGLKVKAWTDPVKAITALSGRDRRKAACLMLDIRMPQMSGLDVHDALIQADANLPIIYMSGHADVALAVKAMQKGAITLLEKPFDESSLGLALDAAFAAPVNDGPAPRSLPAMSATEAAAGPETDHLTTPESPADLAARERFMAREARLSPREREVLGHVIEGVYNKNIADLMGLSIKTVELYRARGMAKMQARSVAGLTRMMVSGKA